MHQTVDFEKKKLVVLTGAGVSAESGIPTFRDADGLWEGHDIMDVATPEGWEKDPDLVNEFYNQRRKAALQAKPNAAHLALAALEDLFEVTIITQNVDNLHEKAGSSHVVHLHGELAKARSSVDENLIYDIVGWEIKKEDVCEKGSRLRPHIVWFGEMVPMMETAIQIAVQADIFIVVGTSLVVYPAASIVDYIPDQVPKYIIDPKMPSVLPRPNLYLIEKKAGEGMKVVAQELMAFYKN